MYFREFRALTTLASTKVTYLNIGLRIYSDLYTGCGLVCACVCMVGGGTS